LVGGTKALWIARLEVVREYEIQAAKKANSKPSSLDEINARRRRK
jgi:hypothetical protein